MNPFALRRARLSLLATAGVAAFALLVACGDDAASGVEPGLGGSAGAAGSAGGNQAGKGGNGSSGKGGSAGAGKGGSEAGGEGGDSGTAGNGGAGGSDTASTAPLTCADAHGAVGCCVDKAVYRVVDGKVTKSTCGKTKKCGWDSDTAAYGCVDPAAPDEGPDGPSATCGEPAVAGACACAVAADCQNGEICDVVSGACVPAGSQGGPCKQDADCAGGICSPDSSTCVECLADADCKTNPAGSVCRASHSCGCDDVNDCGATRPVCDAALKECATAASTANAQAAVGKACTKSTDCGGGVCLTDNGKQVDGGSPMNGVCSLSCAGDEPCGTGNLCLITQGTPDAIDQAYCFPSCKYGSVGFSPTQSSLDNHCKGRLDSVCRPLGTADDGYCLPQCTLDPAAEDKCPAGAACDSSSGLCVPPVDVAGLKTTGEACDPDSATRECLGACLQLAEPVAGQKAPGMCVTQCSIGVGDTCGPVGGCFFTIFEPKKGGTATSPTYYDAGYLDLGGCAKAVGPSADDACLWAQAFFPSTFEIDDAGTKQAYCLYASECKSDLDCRDTCKVTADCTVGTCSGGFCTQSTSSCYSVDGLDTGHCVDHKPTVGNAKPYVGGAGGGAGAGGAAGATGAAGVAGNGGTSGGAGGNAGSGGAAAGSGGTAGAAGMAGAAGAAGTSGAAGTGNGGLAGAAGAGGAAGATAGQAGVAGTGG
jgi:hypothetical protein